MGNNAIISVLSLIIIFGIVNTNLNRKNIQSAQNSYGYVRYTAARDIARNSIHITLKRIDTSAVIPATFSVRGNIDGGSYIVNATSVGDTLRLVARGHFEDTVYSIRTTLLRYPKPYPPTAFESALGLRPTPVRFRINSNTALIDGRDHDSTGTLTPDRSNDVAGVLVMTPSDRDSVRCGAKDTSINLKGNPRIKVNSNISDPDTFVDELIANADFFYQTPPNKDVNLSAMNWGSPSNPVIVFCDARDTNKIKIGGNSRGWGILVVRGSIELSGSTIWYGLVIGYGSTIIEFKTTAGNPKIIGSFLFGGAPNSEFDMRGNGEILFSRATLMKSKNVSKLLAYTILDWYE